MKVDFPVPTDIERVHICGTNIGVHTGGYPLDKNWGTLLTPAIMKWTRDQVTSGNFWEGDYTSSTTVPIGAEGILASIEEQKVLYQMMKEQVNEDLAAEEVSNPTEEIARQE